jgi:hypothetical protein
LNISEEVPILNINLQGNYTTQQLKKYGELLQDDIEEISEIKKVDILGVDDKEVEIAVDIFKMTAAQVTFDVDRPHPLKPLSPRHPQSDRYPRPYRIPSVVVRFLFQPILRIS